MFSDMQMDCLNNLRQFPAAPAPNVPAACRRHLVRMIIGLMAGILLSLPAIRPAISAGEYLLGPQDKVRFKIYEWRASSDSFFEWKALNDTFVVGADGKISLPFTGDLQAAGLSTDTLARSVGERLKQRMGLVRAPDVSVEVAQFRPFYIVGRVSQSGEFPYRPGLTVLQAVSIAGGLKRREDTVSRFEREIISGRGDVEILRLNKIKLLAKKARLEAEQASATGISFPDALTKNEHDPMVASAMQQERAIFETRRKGQETQLQALTELRDFLVKEQDSLKGHLAFQDRQVELYKQDLDGIASLVKKGFATESRQTALERSLVQARSDRLAAETSLLRAQQEMSRTELSMLSLKNQFDNDVRVTLRDTEAQLEEIDSRAQTASRLLYDSELSAPRLAARNQREAQIQPVYTIVRKTADGTAELHADESTAVQPGDTLKVEIPFDPQSDGMDILNANPDPTDTSGIPLPGDQLHEVN